MIRASQDVRSTHHILRSSTPTLSLGALILKDWLKLIDFGTSPGIIMPPQYDTILHAVRPIVAVLNIDRLISGRIRDSLNKQERGSKGNIQNFSLLISCSGGRNRESARDYRNG